MGRDRWNRRYGDSDRLWTEKPSPYLEEEMAALPPGRALDLAAGEGRNAFALARAGWRVDAVDFAAVAVERGAARARELGLDVRWREADVVHDVPPRETYDLVAIFYLHLPWDEFTTVLAHAAAASRPGGVLLVVGHDVRNLTEGTGGPQDPALLHDPGQLAAHLRALELRDFESPADASATRLVVTRAERQARPVDHGDGDRDRLQIDCLVRAVRLVDRGS